MKFNKTAIFITASFLLLFAVILYNFLSLNLWDFDFWWHIATGRYIVQHGSLLQHDPFCFTSSLAENKSLFPIREAFILKQYWLAQVLFYLVYSSAGSKGIIILKAALILSVIFLVYYGLRKKDVRFYISYMVVFLVYRGIGGFSGERPVLFTILFSPLAFLLLDDYKERKGWNLLLLVPLMMLWANLHGGFVLGDVLIIAFMIGESINMIRNKAYTRPEMKKFLLISLAAVAASFVNPNGATAFSIAFSQKYKLFTGAVQEYQSPFYLYINKISLVNYPYVALVFLFPLVLAAKRKKIDITYLIIVAGLCYESLSSMRFAVYYLVIGGIILGRELNAVVDKLFAKGFSTEMKERVERLFAVLLLVSSIFYAIGFLKIEKPRFREEKLFTVPAGGVNFIEKNRINGRIFNDFASGGYLEWRLYPQNKTFIDTRAINAIQIQEYSMIANASYSVNSTEPPQDAGKNKGKSELWERLLDHYNVNIIFLTPMDIYGDIPRLIYRLAESDRWVPVHNDFLSIVYVRNSKANKHIIEKFRRTNDEVLDTVIIQASLRARSSQNPIYFRSLGEIFHKRGRLGDALKAYRYSYARKADPAVLQTINNIEAEIKQKGKKEAQDFSSNRVKS